MDQTFLELLAEIEDFRTGNAVQYRLQDILLVGVLAIICNMDTYTEMALFAQYQRRWLEPFCDFAQGTPSHDTFGKVFSRLDPKGLSERFATWMQDLRQGLGESATLQGKTVAIDGKTICGSRGKAQKASHVVTAFAGELNLVLGQLKTDDKSNEITAIPALLDLFRIKGAVITIDAIGTQKEIAAKIIAREADYVLAVKGNQATLREDIAYHLDSVLADPEQGQDALKKAGLYASTLDKGHGRIEKRTCQISNDTRWFPWQDEWAGFSGCGRIRSTRTVIDGAETVQDHYFIYSLKNATAQDLLRIKRGHWAIENQLHWLLDTAFKEDDCQVRAKNAAEVFNILRKLALQMLKTESTYKCGMKSKRKFCGLGVESAMRVLGMIP